jgi:uridine kinase
VLISIDSIQLNAQCGDTLKTLLTKAGLENPDMNMRPLAAQIGGEIFQLHYDPVRMADGKPAMRSAVEEAGGVISLIRYPSAQGRRVYERTMLFVLMLAVRRHFKNARVVVKFALRGGLYIEIEKNPPLSAADVALLKDECARVVADDLPLSRARLSIADAIRAFGDDGQLDKVRLLNYRKFSYFDVYRQGGHMDYFYGEMAPSTGYAPVFNLQVLYPGMVLMLPDPDDANRPARYEHSPQFSAVFQQSDEWARLLHCDTVADINDMVANGKIRELVRVNEALHEKTYSQMADRIVQRKARAVMMAGPSSSGKTTSANRLCTQLRVYGKSPVLLSLDDYYIDRASIPRDTHGEIDLEHINALDIERFQTDLELLIAGEQALIPRFDFKRGARAEEGRVVRAGPDEPLIIEGIHGLNPALLSPNIPRDSIFKVYVSALTTMNLDDHNRIPTTEMRMLRRIVRDYETRGAGVERTLCMWPRVRKGEEAWIFPYQEEADAFFNTALLYEPVVLKKHIFPLLQSVEAASPYYAQVRYLIKFLNYFLDAQIEDEVPPTSILREFIGGSAFFC